MEEEIRLYIVLAVSIVFAVSYITGILVFFGHAGTLVAGYNFEPECPEAKKLHKKIMRRFGCALLLIFLFLHGTTMAFVFGENVAGGVLAGLSAAVVILLLTYVNMGKVKRWVEEERRIEEDYRSSTGRENKDFGD